MVCPDEMVDPIVRVIADLGFTGQAGDGLVWVTDVIHRVRVIERDADLAAMAAANGSPAGAAVPPAAGKTP